MAAINTEQLKRNVTTGSTWLRLVFMIVFGVFFGIGSWVIGAIAVFQFLHTLFSGSPNRRLLGFSGSLGRYLGQLACYVSYHTDSKPFPFSDWPAAAPSASPSERDSDVQPPAPPGY